jgi:hypothetical protein
VRFGSPDSGRIVILGTVCCAARFNFPHVIGELLQSGAQPSLVVSFFLLFALVHLRNSCHLGNERFDDLIDFFMDRHRFTSSLPARPRAGPHRLVAHKPHFPNLWRASSCAVSDTKNFPS